MILINQRIVMTLLQFLTSTTVTITALIIQPQDYFDFILRSEMMGQVSVFLMVDVCYP